MKRFFSATVCMALLGCLCSVVQAAELLDVKPVTTGSAISVEITADVAMTYSYYKVPGQARAVVDIADADPEKVEPLIVVNKGAVSSISVDKAQIAGMVVSRIVFNLVTESEIAVEASADRKRLTVTFGGSATGPTAAVSTVAAVQPSEPPSSKPTEPAAKPVESPAAVPATPAAAAKEEDPLGLDEPAQPLAAPAASTTEKSIPAAAAPAITMPSIVRVPKLEPVVPQSAIHTQHSIRTVKIGDGFIDIIADGPITGIKTISLKKPERIALDLPATTSALPTKSVPVNKFGIARVRIGVYPGYTRIVLDAAKAVFPKYTITTTPEGLRVTFK